jgi:LysM repeat protein
MKNIIPFKKDVIFKTNISEVTSISLENTLSIKDDIIKGDFLVSGEYKISDKSTSVDPFSLNLPFEIVIDERYNTEKATADIDDFYYEIVNDNVLRIAIDVLIDNLEERPLINDFDLIDETTKREVLEVEEKEEIREAVIEENLKEEVKEERCIESETEGDMQEKINSLFSNFSKDSEVYVTYNVYIVRDGDTLESILDKYNVGVDELKKYNDLSELKLGDKLIIPNTYERD